MENHEIFSHRLGHITEYRATTSPAKDGFHLCVVRTKKPIPETAMLKLTEIAPLKEQCEEQFDDSGCRVLNHKYVFHIPEYTIKK